MRSVIKDIKYLSRHITVINDEALSSIHLSRLPPHKQTSIYSHSWDHQHEFQRNISTAIHIFSIHQRT